MGKKITPWEQLQSVRAEKAETLIYYQSLSAQEIKLRRECLLMLRAVTSELLTVRETEILDILRIQPAISNKEIANDLNLAERTVKFHISSILKKFNVTSRRHLSNPVEAEGIRERRGNKPILLAVSGNA